MKNVVRINIGNGYWWNPEDIREWLNSLGEAMEINTPDGTGLIEVIQANRVCHVVFADNSLKSYSEEFLLKYAERRKSKRENKHK